MAPRETAGGMELKEGRGTRVICWLLDVPATYAASLAEWLRRSPLERKIRSSTPACAVGSFPGRHTGDLKIGTPVAILPGAWRYRVVAGTGWPSVSMLWLVEVEN